MSVPIAGVIIQARHEYPEQYVKTLRILAQNGSENSVDPDGKPTWDVVKQNGGQVSIPFAEPVWATQITFTPETWSVWYPSMRAGLLVRAADLMQMAVAA